MAGLSLSGSKVSGGAEAPEERIANVRSITTWFVLSVVGWSAVISLIIWTGEGLR